MYWLAKLPIITTLFSIYFTLEIGRHWWAKKHAMYLLWWCIGVLFYGAGTFVESWVGLFGWDEPVFRLWYIFGALLGGAPFAQGTVYLLMKRKTADILAFCLIVTVLFASTAVWLSPIDYSLVDPHRLSGKVLEWRWVRLMTPFINTYAFIFLVGGAIWSAVNMLKSRAPKPVYMETSLLPLVACSPALGVVLPKLRIPRFCMCWS
ncbi:MAG: hypothetical protein ACYC1Q_09185 [Bacteroidia bacterium]